MLALALSEPHALTRQTIDCLGTKKARAPIKEVGRPIKKREESENSNKEVKVLMKEVKNSMKKNKNNDFLFKANTNNAIIRQTKFGHTHNSDRRL